MNELSGSMYLGIVLMVSKHICGDHRCLRYTVQDNKIKCFTDLFLCVVHEGEQDYRNYSDYVHMH